MKGYSDRLLLDLGSHLPDAGQNRAPVTSSKIKFNLGNPGLNVYNINKYIARSQI
jgi:hypothetical protein